MSFGKVIRKTMKSIIAYFKSGKIEHVLVVGLIFRLIAAVFSKGYGMHDDHYLVIEAGQSFADGFDYNNWLPWNNDGVPSGHSWFYVGIHFCIFKLLNFLGVDDPQSKMYVIRTIHAFYSLLSVYWSYRIMQLVSTEKAAVRVAWMMALLWFIPNASVRNLVEWVCLPPLILSVYYMIKAERADDLKKYFFVSGLFAGVAMGIRFQVIFFLAGSGLYLLSRMKLWQGILMFSGFVLAFFLTQSADLFFYGRPFAEVTNYINYNIIHSTTYFDQPWYTYFLTIGGMLIPPVSVFLMMGYVKGFRKLLVITLPALVFFAFHSYFPNKQERFILPFIPFFIMAGIAGWEAWRAEKKVSGFESGSWKFFWVLNALGLIVLTTTYTKRSMVEGMYYLYKQPDFNNFIMDVSHKSAPIWPPQFYTGKWNKGYCIYQEYPVEKLKADLDKKPANFPNYVLFFQEVNIGYRIADFKRKTGYTIEYCHTAQPSYFDALLHWLNPRNKNEPVFIFKIVSAS